MKQSANSITSFFHLMQAILIDFLAKKCATMSFSQKKKLAKLLTFFALPMPWLRRKHVTESLMQHLQIDREKAHELSQRVFTSFLINSFEMAGLKYYSDRQLMDKIRVEGLEHLQEALAGKKGTIIVSGHFGLWELVPPWLALNGFDITVVVRRQNNAHIDAWMEKMRQRHGARTTDSGFGMRNILKSLRQGHILALMVDQDNGKQGIFVKFFNQWASAPTGPAAISLKTGAPIVPLAIFPDYDRQHLLKIYPPIYPRDFSDDIAGQQKMTAIFTGLLENIIKLQPENWFWLHRRWKTQPHDAPENPWAKLVLTSEGKAGNNISRV